MNGNQKPKKRDSEFPQDFRMLYEELTTDIENTKRREWSATYYLLLLHASIIGFSEVIIKNQKSLACVQKVILFAIALGITVFGILYLCRLTEALIRYRKRLISVYEHLGATYQEWEDEWQKRIYGVKETSEWKKKQSSFLRALGELPIYLMIMLVIAFGLVCWYLFGIIGP